MSKKRGRANYEPLETDLTPMIDVTFQLIIFFMLILSIRQVYGIAIKFPPPSKTPPPKTENQAKPIFIWVGPDEYTVGHKVSRDGYIKLNDEPISLGRSEDTASRSKEREEGMEFLEKQIEWLLSGKTGKYDTVMTVSGEVNSYHGKIVQVIDRGKKAGVKGFNMAPPQVQ